MVCTHSCPGVPLHGLTVALSQTPHQVFIDVESHEMVDVIDMDRDMKSPSPSPARAPSRPYLEKGGKLTAANTKESF